MKKNKMEENTDDKNDSTQTNADREGIAENVALSTGQGSSSSPSLQNQTNDDDEESSDDKKRFNTSGETTLWAIMLIEAIMKNNQEISTISNTIYTFQQTQYEKEGVKCDSTKLKSKINKFIYNKLHILRRWEYIITMAIPSIYYSSNPAGRIIRKREPIKLQQLLDDLKNK